MPSGPRLLSIISGMRAIGMRELRGGGGVGHALAASGCLLCRVTFSRRLWGRACSLRVRAPACWAAWARLRVSLMRGESWKPGGWGSEVPLGRVGGG